MAAASRARAFALLFHRRFELDRIDGDAAVAGDLARQLDRKTERVVQHERVLTRDQARAVVVRVVDQPVEHRHAAFERSIEGLFLSAQRLHDARDVVAQFGISRFERPHHRGNEFGEKAVRIAEQTAVANRAPNQEAQHVAAIGIGRIDAVVDQERHGARVVGDDVLPLALLRAARSDVSPTGGCAAMISVKRSVSYIEALPLQTASMRSSPAPVSIDFFGQFGQLAVGAAIVLLEDDVPNLDVRLPKFGPVSSGPLA